MHPYLFPGLRASVRAIDYLLHQIPGGAMDEPTAPERFTPREVIAHLADWEPIFVERMKATLKEPGGTILGIDEGQRAAELGYSQWDWERQLELFSHERDHTIRFLESLSEEQWHLASVHNEKGLLRIEDHANMLLGHDLYHIEQLIDVLEQRA